MGWRNRLGVLFLLVTGGICLDPKGPARDAPPWGTLRNWFTGSHSQVGVAHSGEWVSARGPGRSRALLPLQPVALQCQDDRMVVTVQRDLFGTGRLVQPGDLRLGQAFCNYTSANLDNTVTFQTALQDCGSTLQVTQEFVIYSSILSYLPSPSGSRVITRTNQVSVLLQCIYPRNANVSSSAVKPTWDPVHTTVFTEEVLTFSLRLMTDDWTSARSSRTFQLGDVFHLEASVSAVSGYPLRIFLDSCVASPTVDPASSLQYDIVSANGCLVDGKMSASSAFISPRVQSDKLQFTVDAFRFIGTTNSLIFITCSLRVVPAESAPSPVSKACSYRAGSGWSPVEGPPALCSCCDSGSCASLGGSRALHPFSAPRRFGKRGEPKFEPQDLAVGPLIVLSENDVAGADVPLLDILGLSDGETSSMLGLQDELLASEMALGGVPHRTEESAIDFELEGNGPPQVVDWKAVLDGSWSVEQGLKEDTALLETGPVKEELVNPLEMDMEGSLVVEFQGEDLASRLQDYSQVHIVDPVPLKVLEAPEAELRGNQLDVTPLELVKESGILKSWQKDNPEVHQEHRSQHVSLQALDQQEALLKGSPKVHMAQLVPLVVLNKPQTNPEVHIAQLGPLEVKDTPEVYTAELGPLQVLDHPEVHIAHLEPLEPLDHPETTPDGHIAQLGSLEVLDDPETNPKVHITQLELLDQPQTLPEVHITQLEPLEVLYKPVQVSQPVPPEVLGDHISVGNQLVEVISARPEEEGLRSLQTVHSGPIVVVNKEAIPESEVSKSLKFGPDIDLDIPNLVNVGPITFQDLLSGDNDTAEPGSKPLWEFTVGPVSDAPHPEAAVMRMESPASVLGEGLVFGPIPPANHFKSLVEPGVTPLVRNIQHQPLLPDQTLWPVGDWRTSTELVGTQEEAGRERLVEVILLTTAGVVLACMVVLGGFLVYRKRNHSLV